MGGGGGLGGGGRGWVVKIQKKDFFWGGGGSMGGGRGRVGGQSGCERRIEVFVKIQKTDIFSGCWDGGRFGVGLGVRVDVNEELKFL